MSKFLLNPGLWIFAALLFFSAIGSASAVESVDLKADGRFYDFNTQAWIRIAHPELEAQAEKISHWAAYYTLNPILLTKLIAIESMGESAEGLSIRALAKKISGIARTNKPETGQLLTQNELIGALEDSLSLSHEKALNVVTQARQSMKKAGLSTQVGHGEEHPPALDLPFARPAMWQFNGAHTWTGTDDGSPMSSIDFVRSWTQSWGSDTSEDWVAASHDGTVNVLSSCYVQVTHSGGWGTRYYHLDNVVVSTGDEVRAGEPLGVYAAESEQALCSGGHSSGPHVHFALMKNGGYYSLSGIEFSGYSVHPGDSSYDSNRDRMWLEKRGQRYYAFDQQIGTEPGDNTIDYRYNGMWYSSDNNGHGLNIEISEYLQPDGSSLKAVFAVMYTYDDDGLANFYVGNIEFDRWRSDEAMVIPLLQTQGGDLSNLTAIDFEDPDQVSQAGELIVLFDGCGQASAVLSLKERATGQFVELEMELVKLIGVPEQVCQQASVDISSEQ